MAQEGGNYGGRRGIKKNRDSECRSCFCSPVCYRAREQLALEFPAEMAIIYTLGHRRCCRVEVILEMSVYGALEDLRDAAMYRAKGKSRVKDRR